MSQPPIPSPDDNAPATGATAGSRPTQPAVPPLPPTTPPAYPTAPSWDAAAPTWNQSPAQPEPPAWNQPPVQPAPTAWAQQPQTPPWEQVAPQNSPYGTYAAPYTQPQYAQYGGGLGLAPQKKTMGVIALVFGLIAAVGSSLLALALGGAAIRRVAEFQQEYGDISGIDLSTIDLSYFSSVRDSFLGLEISLWVGTLAGIAAIVLGIIAIAQRKGRGFGITALILGVVGPLVWAIGAAIGGLMAGMPV